MTNTTTTTFIPTTRDMEAPEARVIADALYDLRATRTHAEQAYIVRAAAAVLGQSEAAVWAALNRAAAE